MTDHGAIEQQLFESGYGLADVDYEYLTFSDATSKVQIGPYPAGTRFAIVSLYWTRSLIQVWLPEDYDDETPSWEGKLILKIGE